MLSRFLFIFCLLLATSVKAEIRPFHGYLEAASFFVHYTSGYIQTPGHVDLSNLKFAVANPERQAQNAVADLVLFRVPDSCAHAKRGCDWTDLGVGFKDDFGDVIWCCSPPALKAGVCKEEDLNRLVVHKTPKVPLERRVLDIPGKGNAKLTVREPVFDLTDDDDTSGKYILLMANCNDNGRTVSVDGTYTFKSTHGYLPGDLFGEYHYFFFVFCAYVALAGWYGWLYRKNEESKIPIQKWIFGTILLGLLEAFFRCIDYMVWNAVGTRHPIALYTGIITGALKHTLARCLLVMVSLGWGVVCDTLGRNFRRLIVLAIVYATLGIAADIVAIVTLSKMTKLMARGPDIKLLGAEAIIGLILAGLNLLFLVWIFAGMARTMAHLKNTQQDVKLERYRQLRLLLVFFAVFAITWFILMRFEIVYQFLPNSEAWIVQTLMEVNYLAMITGVAILWRPNSNAREYAYEMQLASDEEHELELTEEIPSAAALDDDAEFAVLPVEQGVKT